MYYVKPADIRNGVPKSRLPPVMSLWHWYAKQYWFPKGHGR